MNKFEKIYKELRKTYSEEEIADSMLIPKDMTQEELEASNGELRAFRLKLMRERTEQQRIYTELLRFKYLMEDYIKDQPFSQEKSFGKHLEEYVRILKRTKKRLSEDLDIHYTRFSRIVNDREEPNVELLYRLEVHSGQMIPAVYWWKLVSKKQEFLIKQDLNTRAKESKKVKNAIAINNRA